MTTGTSIKDRCRLCYTRLKDTSSLHQRICSSQQANRIFNIYKRRPFRYRDLIVRYLSISLPENNPNDPYSTLICGTCATSLTDLEAAYRSYEETQKNLRSKFRKTSQIVRYQLEKQLSKVTASAEKSLEPKRLSKRKGAPKHINQTLNHQKKSTNNGQLFLKLLNNHHHEDESSLDSLSTKRTSSKSRNEMSSETTNQKKRFKTSKKDLDSSVI